MRNLKIADPDSDCRNYSPLADRLVQLTQPPGEETAEPAALEAPGWLEQWNANQEQISSRLALIESELDRLAGSGPEPPQLSVFDSDPEYV